VDDQVTFYGEWTLSGGDCPDDQTDPTSVIWYDLRGKEAYATFTFNDDLTEVLDWIEHEDLADTEPAESGTSAHQWYITDMYADYDDSTGVAAYYLEETTSIEGLIPLYLTHDLSITFHH